MKIENLRLERAGVNTRSVGTVIWEDSDRPAQEIYFEAEESLAPALTCRPEAFLAACVTPALWARERRIQVEGEVCPEMLYNLRVATRFFQHWFAFDTNTAVIEAKPRSRVLDESNSKTAALFFSGGLDSLAALRTNRLGFSPEHPGWLKDGIVIYGLEVENEEPFRHVLEALTDLARPAGLNLLPVSTNIRALNPDWKVFWWSGYMGPALCAVAHALGRRIASVVVASDCDVPHLVPHGTHPVVEPNYSSHELKVRYDGLTLSRLEKARLVAEWPPALQHMRVCNKPELYAPGRLNCGECEKCIRTKLELLSVGALDKATAFENRELTTEMITKQVCVMEKTCGYYTEVVEPLTRLGREDLAEAVEEKIKDLRRRLAGDAPGLRGVLIKVDRRLFNSRLRSLKRKMWPSQA